EAASKRHCCSQRSFAARSSCFSAYSAFSASDRVGNGCAARIFFGGLARVNFAPLPLACKAERALTSSAMPAYIRPFLQARRYNHQVRARVCIALSSRTACLTGNFALAQKDKARERDRSRANHAKNRRDVTASGSARA